MIYRISRYRPRPNYIIGKMRWRGHVMRIFICFVVVIILQQLLIVTIGLISTFTHNDPQFLRKDVLENNASLARRPRKCNGCFQRPYSYLLNAPNVCRSRTGLRNVELLMLVTSAPDNRDRRDAIRRTWLSGTKSNLDSPVRSVFLLGYSNRSNLEKLTEENEKHNDIVLQDFNDVYENLTLKTLMGFEWVGRFCLFAKFIMKTDDDMFVNTTNILHLMREKRFIRRPYKIVGQCKMSNKPFRDPKSKWYVTWSQYPESVYPEFCTGTGYVMSIILTLNIVRISPNVPFFPFEDVYIGLCARELGYVVHDIERFKTKNAPVPILGCDKYRSAKTYTIHQVSPRFLLKTWLICGFGNSTGG